MTAARGSIECAPGSCPDILPKAGPAAIVAISVLLHSRGQKKGMLDTISKLAALEMFKPSASFSAHNHHRLKKRRAL